MPKDRFWNLDAQAHEYYHQDESDFRNFSLFEDVSTVLSRFGAKKEQDQDDGDENNEGGDK